MEHVIAVIDALSEEWSDTIAILPRHGYSIRTVRSLEGLEALMHETDCRVVLIDLDSFPEGNRFFRSLKTVRPDSNIFVVSSRLFHPELKEALSTHICACFRKPLDVDELLFWLKAVLGEPRERAPTDHSLE